LISILTDYALYSRWFELPPGRRNEGRVSRCRCRAAIIFAVDYRRVDLE
jgi:hypothetical protein